MTEHWAVVPLADIVDPTRGISYGVVQPGEYQDEGIPIVRVTDIRDGLVATQSPLRIASEIEAKYSRTRLRGGELLLSLVGTVGQTAVVGSDLVGWNTARAVGVIPVINPPGARWVHYVLQSRESQAKIKEWCNTTVQATLNLRDVARLPIILPPSDERKRIESVLSALDDKIEMNQRMNETLDVMARALFKSWFVDFDPVRAKMAGRVSFGVDASTGALFPSAMSGDLPKGWNRCSLGDVAAVNACALGTADDLSEIEYIEISDVVRGKVLGSTKYMRDAAPSRARRRLCHGDTAISTVRPERASYFLCLEPGPNLVGSTGFAVLSPRTVPWTFLHCGATQSAHFEELGRLADGGAYPAVRSDAVAALRLVVPDNEHLLAIFHERITPMFELCRKNDLQSKTLASLRDLLLPKLLSGELRVRDAEREVEKVA